MAHDMEISFFADKKSENFCAGSITERQTRKVTETQKNNFVTDLIFLIHTCRRTVKTLQPIGKLNCVNNP